MTAALQLHALTRSFGASKAVDNVSLAVGQGEFVTILGPSGSGKSTTLRLIAGLETPDSGSIQIQGVDVTALPAHKRDSAMVFQNYALFPHRTVADNIAFGLATRGLSRTEVTSRIHSLLVQVGLDGMGNRKPHQLSGGQQQRVALARALAVNPAVLLLDEPLGALDLALRRQMQSELRAIQRARGSAFIHVTHDQAEALAMSDRVAVMAGGRIVQIGTPEDIYERPESRFVADFMGFRNFLSVAPGSDRTLRIAGLDLPIRAPDGATPESLVAAIRPEQVRIGGPITGAPLLRGEITSQTYTGSSWVYGIATSSGGLIEASSDRRYHPGDAVHLTLDPGQLVLLPA